MSTFKQFKAQSSDESALMLLHLHLGGLETSPGDMRFSLILSALGSSIRQATKELANMDKYEATNEDPESEPPFFEQLELIETLLGLVFVVAQAYISAVVSFGVRFHQRFNELFHKSLWTFDGKKRNQYLKATLLSLDAENVTGTKIPIMVAVEAFANYYKHQDEWGKNWSRSKSQVRSETIDLVQQLGATARSGSNLQMAFQKIFGHSRFEDMSSLARALEKWRATIIRKYDEELKKQKQAMRKAGN